MFKRTKPGFIIILSLFFVIKFKKKIFLTNLIGLFRWSYTRSFWSYFTLDLLLNFEIWSLFPSIPTPTIIYVKNYQKKNSSRFLSVIFFVDILMSGFQLRIRLDSMIIFSCEKQLYT